MIVMYATSDYGKGYVSDVGHFNSLDEIQIRVGLWSDDVVITFAEEKEEKQ